MKHASFQQIQKRQKKKKHTKQSDAKVNDSKHRAISVTKQSNNQTGE